MEFKRIVLIGALVFVAVSLWKAWYAEHPVQTPQATPAAAALNATADSSSKKPNAELQAFIAEGEAEPGVKISSAKKLIEVKTDVLKMLIDPTGGNIVSAHLLQYPLSDDNRQETVQLLNSANDKFYVAQSGLIGHQGPDTVEGQATYTSRQNKYVLAPGQDLLQVDLTWRKSNGLEVTKTYTFQRGNYAVKLDYQIDNQSSKDFTGQFYTQIKRKEVPDEAASFFQISSYAGAAISSPEKLYEKLPFSKLAKQSFSKTAKGGWAAMQQHYFLSAWVPEQSQTYNYYGFAGADKIYTVGMITNPIEVNAGEQQTLSATFYAGPEVMATLKALAPGLDLTIDYGWLWFVSVALFWILNLFYQWIGNWGWAIVLVTCFVKLLFFNLSSSSYHSMARMRKLQPRLAQLKERYGDDKQRLGVETMALYKKEKINPLGGCLPIIVQIPVFIALYWVLLESVELRQAPFMLWITDLSTKDPYYVLPILMGLTLYWQQRLNPTPTDPVMAKVMVLMPVMLTVFFLNFPAGLVLYWVVNNALSIVQQWYINKKIAYLK